MRKSQEIVETGYVGNYTGKWDINYSSILTELIHSAGRYCERYASDLFIDWRIIENRLTGDDIFSAEGEDIYYFGMRESGVDHEAWIRSRIAENPDIYRALYRLEVVRDRGKMTMTLKRVDAWDIKKELAA